MAGVELGGAEGARREVVAGRGPRLAEVNLSALLVEDEDIPEERTQNVSS